MELTNHLHPVKNVMSYTSTLLYIYIINVKGKVHCRTGHEGPEGEQRYSSTLSLISVLDGGGW